MVIILAVSDLVALLICYIGLASVATYITFKYAKLVGFVKYYKLEKYYQEYVRINKGL